MACATQVKLCWIQGEMGHGHLYYICWNLRGNIPVSNDS